MMDQNYYNSCSTEQNGNPHTGIQSHHNQNCVNGAQPAATPQSPIEGGCFQGQIGNSPSQMIQKRKRSVNPQADENFIKALEAVRFGGIGFCKAARMYGVNNRTLWLEYKKRGYPNFRLSIKNRKQETQTQATNAEQAPVGSNEQVFLKQEHPVFPRHEPVYTTKASDVQSDQILCTTAGHPVALISGTFFEGKHLDLGQVLHRPKYLDPTLINAAQGINFQSINFEQM